MSSTKRRRTRTLSGPSPDRTPLGLGLEVSGFQVLSKAACSGLSCGSGRTSLLRGWSGSTGSGESPCTCLGGGAGRVSGWDVVDGDLLRGFRFAPAGLPDHSPVHKHPVHLLSLAFNLCCLPGNFLPVLSGVSL